MRPAVEQLLRNERLVIVMLAGGVAASVVMLFMNHPVAAAGNMVGVAVGGAVAYRERKARLAAQAVAPGGV